MKGEYVPLYPKAFLKGRLEGFAARQSARDLRRRIRNAKNLERTSRRVAGPCCLQCGKPNMITISGAFHDPETGYVEDSDHFECLDCESISTEEEIEKANGRSSRTDKPGEKP